MTEDGGEQNRAPLLLKSNKEAGWLARRVRTSPLTLTLALTLTLTLTLAPTLLTLTLTLTLTR